MSAEGLSIEAALWSAIIRARSSPGLCLRITAARTSPRSLTLRLYSSPPISFGSGRAATALSKLFKAAIIFCAWASFLFLFHADFAPDCPKAFLIASMRFSPAWTTASCFRLSFFRFFLPFFWGDFGTGCFNGECYCMM